MSLFVLIFWSFTDSLTFSFISIFSVVIIGKFFNYLPASDVPVTSYPSIYKGEPDARGSFQAPAKNKGAKGGPGSRRMEYLGEALSEPL